VVEKGEKIPGDVSTPVIREKRVLLNRERVRN